MSRHARFLPLLALLFGFACIRAISPGTGHRAPLPENLILDVPPVVASSADTITDAAMRNVLFHVDDDIQLRVRHLKGKAKDLRGEHVIVLDDKKRILLEIAHAEIGLTADDLTLLLNRYVFGYAGSPLKNLVVKTVGDHIEQSGVMHKVIDIPFNMKAQLSVTDDGRIRIHPTQIRIAGLDGEGLMKAVGADLSELLDLSKAKGASVSGNDILLEPLKILPPPAIDGRLTSIRVEGDEVVQTFGSADSPNAAPLTPQTEAQNYIYFRGGTIRFGKLYMVQSDLLAVDADPSDPFDFYLDYYHTQLVAGHHTTETDYGLVAVLPDFADLRKTVVTPASQSRMDSTSRTKPTTRRD
jgi:hypothetical protein